jgi:hypothetical protein
MQRRFKDQFSLYQMLVLRRAGWDLKSLGVLFGVDFTSIAHWCDIMSVKPDGHQTLKLHVIFHLPELKEEIPEYKKVPKSYMDYLKESIEREKKRRNPNV